MAEPYAGYCRLMGIGASIFLIAVGLILALAVSVDLAGVDLQMVGWILTAVGVIGLALTMVLWGRRRAVVPDHQHTHPTYDHPTQRYEQDPRY
jgi:formate hydrogenlyase subunit 3/multisubunit Na+/H+ antiporter MnhD subunit